MPQSKIQEDLDNGRGARPTAPSNRMHKPASDFYSALRLRMAGTDVPVAPSISVDSLAIDNETGAPLQPKRWYSIRVYPVKFEHFEQFLGAIEKTMLEMLDVVKGENGEIDERKALTMFPRIIAIIGKNLSGMVEQACVAWEGEKFERDDTILYDGHVLDGDEQVGRVELSKLPLHIQAECIAAWLKESFMEGKFRPLLGMVEELATKMTGQKVSISQLLSSSFARPATPITRSSSIGERAGPTADGPSPSSATSSVPRDPSTGAS